MALNLLKIMPNKYKTLGFNTFLIFIGNASAKLLGLIMLPFYTKWLSVEDYGITDIISVYATCLISIVSCCIYDAIFIFPRNQELNLQKQYFSSGIAFTLLVGSCTAFLFGIIESVSDYYHFNFSFTRYIWFIYALLFSEILQKYAQQFTRSINKMLIYSTTGIIVTGSTAIFSIILIPKKGVDGYVYSLVISHFIGALFAFIASQSYRFFNINKINITACKEMLYYSIPLIPNGLMWWLVNAANRPILEKYASYREIGLLAVAQKFPGILSMLFLVFINSWQISVIDEFGKKNYSDFYNKIFKLVFFSFSFILAIITFCSKFMINVLTTTEYYDAWIHIPILTLGVFFSNLGAFAGCNFSAVRISKYYFYSSMWAAISAVILNITLVPFLGLLGASVSTMLSMLIMAISRFKYSWQFVKIKRISQYIMVLFFNIILYLMVVANCNLLLSMILLIIMLIFTLYSNKSIIKKAYIYFKKQ